MTDNEIVKALECCGSPISEGYVCDGCPYYGNGCTINLFCDALGLINRQKAEIERLKEAYAVYEETTGLKWARGEAIKEFAERLKEKRGHDFPFTRTVFLEDIEDLVKEMTEETK